MMFKLYDKDANGEIDPDEMEDIFTKLCKVDNWGAGEGSTFWRDSLGVYSGGRGLFVMVLC